MFWKIVLKGDNPSGRLLAVLYARTGETIDSVRTMLGSPSGMVLQAGLSRDSADTLVSELPGDGSVQILVQPDQAVYIPVLMGYRPGSRGRLRIALQKLSQLPTEDVIRFLARIPIALKLDADLSTAELIKKILEKAGGIVEIRSPGNLVGVSSRKEYTKPTTRKVVQVTEQVDKAVSNPVLTAVPPVVSDAVYTAGSNSDIPGVIDFRPPSRSVAEAPPPVKEGIDDTQIEVSPHAVRFTVPAAVIPPVAEGEQPVSVPPRSSRPTVMVYLFPVASEIRQRVQSALCEKLGFSADKAGLLVSRAPAAVAGFSRRSDALAAMTELTDYGIPVSLVPDSSPDADVSQGKSLIGWLSGHGPAS